MRLPWKRREQWQERLGRNKTILWEKLREALASVVPITVIVLILSFTVAPIPTETLLTIQMLGLLYPVSYTHLTLPTT